MLTVELKSDRTCFAAGADSRTQSNGTCFAADVDSSRSDNNDKKKKKKIFLKGEFQSNTKIEFSALYKIQMIATARRSRPVYSKSGKSPHSEHRFPAPPQEGCRKPVLGVWEEPPAGWCTFLLLFLSPQRCVISVKRPLNFLMDTLTGRSAVLPVISARIANASILIDLGHCYWSSV